MSKGGGSKFARKQEYFSHLINLLSEYRKVLIVEADNVGSRQLQLVRQDLRGKAVLLMGKNTMIRKCVRSQIPNNPSLEALVPHIKGNVGLIFTNSDLSEIRTKVAANKVKAPAKSGAIAPVDVTVPAGSTGQDPAKTSFFQALSIATKITKGSIEIVNDVNLIKTGSKVTASQAALLQMLNIMPFEYALGVKVVYDDGSIYPVALLDITDDDILAKFRRGISNIAALSLQIGYPTVASIPYAMVGSFRNLLSISLATEYTFKEAEEIKDMIANPEKLAALAAASASSAPAAGGAPAAGAAAAKAPEPEEEEEDMDAGGLFGDDDDY